MPSTEAPFASITLNAIRSEKTVLSRPFTLRRVAPARRIVATAA